MSPAESIGDRVRRIRQSRGLSLRKVAQELGVSPSLLSQVETAKSRPSVGMLYSLAGFFGVSADELLGLVGAGAAQAPQSWAPPAPEVQRAEENPVIEMEDGVRWERLATNPDGRTDSLLVTYAPGASSAEEGKLTRHSGFEHAYILEGELTLQLEFETYTLGPGDSLQFESSRPHAYVNRGPGIARGVWFVMGRRSGSPDLALGAAGVEGSPVSASRGLDVLRRMEHLD